MADGGVIGKVSLAASQGLTRAEVIATVLGGRAMTSAEQTAFDKARGIWKLREAKRKAEKKAVGPMTGAERVAKNRLGAVRIDAQLDAARAKVDTKRRASAERSLCDWLCTYGIGVFVDDPPSKHGREILREMETAVEASQPYQILIARGGGKTSYAEALTAYLVATGRRKFVLISSINAKQAQQILSEIARVFTSEPFATDYPDVALPIILLDGHGRRSQKQGGHDTEVRIVGDTISLPKISMPDGSPSIASGAMIKARALKSVRGAKNGTQRPDLILLDDLQTREIAESEERVADVLNLIRGDVMGLAGKGKAAIISTATSIAADDVTQVLEQQKAVWKTTRFPAIKAWPKEWDKKDHGLWGEYFTMFDEENVGGEKHTRRGGSLAFYRANRERMDAGSDVLSPDNFSKKDGQISGLQKMLDKYHEMGHDHFMAEYQMEPIRHAFAVDISARVIASRIRAGVPAGALIDGHVLTVAATDLNPSYAITTAVASFDVNRSCLVGAHVIRPVKILESSNDTEFRARVYDAVAAHAREIASLGVRLDAWGIDAGGKQFEPVTAFANEYTALPVFAMVGRAGRNWNPNVRSKIRAAINDTVLCQDAATRRRWIAWNADLYKESAQRAWLSEIGSPGGCSLFDGGTSHTDFCVQIANEKLVDKIARASGDGYEYRWKTKEPHDFGDVMAMLYALAGANGLNGSGTQTPNKIIGARKAKFYHF